MRYHLRLVLLIAPLVTPIPAPAEVGPRPTRTPSASELTLAYEQRHPQVRRVQGRVTEPVPLAQPQPLFPDSLKHKVITASPIIVLATISTSGSVIDPVILVSAHPEFNESVLSAVKQWRYKPATLDGVPVPVLLNVMVRIEVR